MKTRNTLAGALFTLSVIVVVAYNCANNNPSKDAKTNTDQQLAYKDSAFWIIGTRFLRSSSKITRCLYSVTSIPDRQKLL